jgi:hypothetical protein
MIPNANTWGTDPEGRVIYLVRFNHPLPETQACEVCGESFTKEKALDRRESDWDKHQLKHRIWRYVDTDEPFPKGVGLLIHRHCLCGIQYAYLEAPIWCSSCGGYVPILTQTSYVKVYGWETITL